MHFFTCEGCGKTHRVAKGTDVTVCTCKLARIHPWRQRRYSNVENPGGELASVLPFRRPQRPDPAA